MGRLRDPTSVIECFLIACLVLTMPEALRLIVHLPWSSSGEALVFIPATALAVGVVAVGLVRSVAGWRDQQLPLPVLGLGVCFAIFVGASAAWSADPSASVQRGAQVALMVAIAAIAAGGVRIRWTLAIAWVVGATAQAAIALAQFILQRSLNLGCLGEPQWPEPSSAPAVISVAGELWGRAPGLTVHPNSLAGYLVIGIAFILALALVTRGPLTMALWVALCLVTAGQLATFSRAGWIASLLVVGLILGWTIVREPARRERALWLGGLVCATTLGFVVAYPQLFAARTLLTSLQAGWGAIPYEVADLDIRLTSQEYTLRVITNHPLTGLGAGAYQAGVYSVPLWIAAELGLVGLVLWVSWQASALVLAVRRVVSKAADVWGTTGLAALVAISVGSLLNPDVWTSDLGRSMLALLVGLGSSRAVVDPRSASAPQPRLAPGLVRAPARFILRLAGLRMGLASLAPVIPLLFIVVSASASHQPPLLSPDEAALVATRHVEREAASGHIPEWKDAEVGPAVPYFDMNGVVAAYVVEVREGERDTGYVTVSARSLANPVLEFSQNPAYHRRLTTTRGDSSLSGLSVDLDHRLYLGALGYYYPAVKPGTNEVRLVDMRTGQARLIASLPAQPQALPEAPSPPSGAVAPSAIGLPAYRLLSAPAYVQFWYAPSGCWVGCVPTASGIMMGYWADRGYPQLVLGGSEGDYQGTIIRLRELMGTFCSEGAGWTYYARIRPGMESFTRERGYNFRSDELFISPSFEQYIREIDSWRPVQIDLSNSVGDQHHPSYGDHSVTGVGYEYVPGDPNYRYMIIHDNWGSYEVWLQYGVNYDWIGFNTLYPVYEVYLPFVSKNH